MCPRVCTLHTSKYLSQISSSAMRRCSRWTIFTRENAPFPFKLSMSNVKFQLIPEFNLINDARNKINRNEFLCSKQCACNQFSIFRNLSITFVCGCWRQTNMELLKPVRQGFKRLMKELNKKPKSYQLMVGATIGFVVAFPTIQLVKALAFVLGVVLIVLSIMNKFVLEIPVPTPNLPLNRLKSIFMENTVFFTGVFSGYLIGMRFA